MRHADSSRWPGHRWVVGLATVALVAPTVALANDRFPDVGGESPHHDAISALADRGVMEGRADDRFDPGRTLTRAQLASIVVRAAGLQPSDARPFEDVSDGPHVDNIAAAHEAGLVRGYEDGTFRPSEPILRDQIAAVLHRWLETPPAESAQFNDLHNTVHAAAINSLAQADIARGTGDNEFRPRASLRRDQSASFVWRGIEWLQRERPGWDGEQVLEDDMPEGDVSGVAHHGIIPVTGLSSLNIVDYDRGTVMVAFGSEMGLRTYDITDPLEPTELDVLPVSELEIEGDEPGAAFWTAESLNIDKDRNVAFLSRDPRSIGGNQDDGTAGFYVIDLRDPADIRLMDFHEVPAGHTTTCVNRCEFLWSGGPLPAEDQPDEWLGRPIFVSDVRDLDNVVVHDGIDEAVDTGRYRGVTDYAHDVQVDQMGIAWVSGRSGVRGYWTEGVREDPTTGETREATPLDPVPYAGGEVGEYTEPDDDARMLGAIHNSERPVDGEYGELALEDSERPRRPAADDGADLDLGYEPGELIYVTDENFSEPCGDAGKFYIASLEGSFDGEGWYEEDHEPEDGGFALEQVGVWGVADEEGAADGDEEGLWCSSHYFQMREGTVAGTWYSQGFRFLDVTDPTDPIQTAYYRPTEGMAFIPMWHGDVIYGGDMSLGIHLLTLDAEAEAASAERQEVRAPALTSEQVAVMRATSAGLEPDDAYGWSCPIPAAPADA